MGSCGRDSGNKFQKLLGFMSAASDSLPMLVSSTCPAVRQCFKLGSRHWSTGFKQQPSSWSHRSVPGSCASKRRRNSHCVGSDHRVSNIPSRSGEVTKISHKCRIMLLKAGLCQLSLWLAQVHEQHPYLEAYLKPLPWLARESDVQIWQFRLEWQGR